MKVDDLSANRENKTMQTECFDLNDIEHEPSDRQLASLMEAVAEESRRRAELARQALMQRLREEIVAANLLWGTPCTRA